MRVFILAFSILAIFAGADIARAGPSTTVRDQLASVDPAILADATQGTEDQIGLDKAKRRHVRPYAPPKRTVIFRRSSRADHRE